MFSRYEIQILQCVTMFSRHERKVDRVWPCSADMKYKIDKVCPCSPDMRYKVYRVWPCSPDIRYKVDIVWPSSADMWYKVSRVRPCFSDTIYKFVTLFSTHGIQSWRSMKDTRKMWSQSVQDEKGKFKRQKRRSIFHRSALKNQILVDNLRYNSIDPSKANSNIFGDIIVNITKDYLYTYTYLLIFFSTVIHLYLCLITFLKITL